jgi:hypothetical protein
MQDPEQPLPQQHPLSAELSEELLDFQFFNTEEHKPPPVEPRLVIKLPPMPGDAPLRRSTRNRTSSQGSFQSGSEYHDSQKSMMDEDDNPPTLAESPQSPPLFVKSQRGRVVKKTYYHESSDDDVRKIFGDDDNVEHVNSRADPIDGDDEGEDHQPRRRTRSSSKRSSINDDGHPTNGRVLRNRHKNPPLPPTTSSGRVTRQPKRFEPNNNPPKRLTRAQSKAAAETDDGYVDEPSDGSVDADGSFDDAPRTSSDIDLDAEGEIDHDEPEPEVERDDGKPYSLRQRTTKINYAIPPALEEMKPAKPRQGGARAGGNKKRGPGWSASGAELSRWMGMGQADDSVRSHAIIAVHQLNETFIIGL